MFCKKDLSFLKKKVGPGNTAATATSNTHGWTTWLIHAGDMAHSCRRRHSSFIEEMWLIRIGDVTHSCGRHKSFMWET